MKLFDSKIKKFLTFLEMEPCTFSAQAQKKKKDNPPREMLSKLRETKTLKKYLIFSQKKAFIIFHETETPKKFFIFQETELSYVSGNRNPKQLLIFQEVTLRARKI